MHFTNVQFSDKFENLLKEMWWNNAYLVLGLDDQFMGKFHNSAKQISSEEMHIGMVDIHGLTWVYDGVVRHVWGGEGFVCQVCYPVTEIIVMCCDKAALLAVKGVADWGLVIEAVVVCGTVWGL